MDLKYYLFSKLNSETQDYIERFHQGELFVLLYIPKYRNHMIVKEKCKLQNLHLTVVGKPYILLIFMDI